MKNIETLVFGCSGSIGKEISKNLNKYSTLFLSRNKPKQLKNINWKKIDLNGDLKSLPKNVEKIFFLSSPYYLKKNMKKKILEKEYIWLKKILKRINFKQIVYFSSSSVYLKKHPVGIIKKKCEKFLKNNKIEILQIWRPFNIIGIFENNLSDHFHNLLIKEFVKRKKLFKEFYGNEGDKRGYSSAKKFSKIVVDYSKKEKSFIMNYGNTNTITVGQIVNIFFNIFKKKYRKVFKVTFKNNKKNINIINSTKKIKTINSNEKSITVLKDYFSKLI